jgi:acyl-CoA synthetase (AMP-forming)/AMP-acid ligase II
VARCAPKHAQLHTFVALPDVTDPGQRRRHLVVRRRDLDEALAGQSAERDFAERSPDDIHIIYTGGTTGFPKGVMWRHEDFWRVLGGGIDFYTGEPLDEYDQSKQATDPRMVTFPLSPLMHGGAQAGPADAPVRRHLTILEPKFDPQRTVGDHRAGEGAAHLHDRRRRWPGR